MILSAWSWAGTGAVTSILVLACGGTTADTGTARAYGGGSAEGGESNAAIAPRDATGAQAGGTGANVNVVGGASGGGSAGAAEGGVEAAGAGGSGGLGGAAGSAGAGGAAGTALGGAAGTMATGGAGGADCGSGWLEGLWSEVAQIECLTGLERVPEQPIQELRIENGAFTVTWVAIERYYDYWGSYEAMPIGAASGSIQLTVQDGNYVPADIVPSGRFEVCGDTLVLTPLWLGSPQDGVPPRGCGHRFRRY